MQLRKVSYEGARTMKRTVPVNKASLDAIIKGMERFRDNYRFRYQGEWLKVVDAKPGERGYTLLTLESVI